MSSWVKADFTFRSRAAVMRLRMRDVEDSKHFEEAAKDPDRLEAYLRIIITDVRPDLKGLEIYGIRANFRTKLWEITVTHGSLPSQKNVYDELPVIDLWNDSLSGKPENYIPDMPGMRHLD